MRFQVISLLACAGTTTARHLHTYSPPPSPSDAQPSSYDNSQPSDSAPQPFYDGAQPSYEYSRSELQGNFSKYRCIDTSRLIAILPTCLYGCQIKANEADGCAYDDMTCHCANYDAYTKLIEPCAFPPALGGNGTCTTTNLSLARPIISEMCNFLNTTSYRSYRGCPQKLSRAKTYSLLALETENKKPDNEKVKWNGTHWYVPPGYAPKPSNSTTYGISWNGTHAYSPLVNATSADGTAIKKNRTGCWWKA